jgi:hypothetical protein
MGDMCHRIISLNISSVLFYVQPYVNKLTAYDSRASHVIQSPDRSLVLFSEPAANVEKISTTT